MIIPYAQYERGILDLQKFCQSKSSCRHLEPPTKKKKKNRVLHSFKGAWLCVPLSSKIAKSQHLEKKKTSYGNA